MKTAILIVLCSLLSLPVTQTSGQTVIFTKRTDLLHPVTGFADYSDCAVDMNGDFLDDVVRVGGKGIYIDYQQKDGTFKQDFYNVALQVLPTWSICAGDIDNNGYNDLLMASSSAVSFVSANHAGSSYTEMVMPVVIASQRSTMSDINNDGWLDAFVCNDTARSIPFRNLGSGIMFPDTLLVRTSHRPGSYSAIWVDYDNDNDDDLYITKCKAGAPPDHIDRISLLYRNNGDGTFTEVAPLANLDDNAQSWSTAFEDFDNDGDFDAFIVNHDFQNRLMRNNGDGTFTDVILSSGINPNDLGAFENSTGDFNNDGFMDIFSDLQQQLYLGKGDLTFTGQTLPMIPGAIADMNNDGFLDVVHRGRLFINEANPNHWIKVNTLGMISNQNGIGARVEIYGDWGVQIREVRSGQSYSPMSSLNIHFGLGEADFVDSLVVRWPSGIVTMLTALNADTTYIIPEAACIAQQVHLDFPTDTSVCEGIRVTINAPDGFSNYAWSNDSIGQSITVDQEGRYFAILTDSLGCVTVSNAITINFIEQTKPDIVAVAGNQICEGDTLTLSATGFNLHWSTGESGSSIQVTQPGTYTVAAQSICFFGEISSDPFVVNVLSSAPPEAGNIEITNGDSVLLMADGENIHWFDAPVGGNLLATGDTFQTPPITTNSTYYIESHHVYPGEIQHGGKADTSGQGGLPEQTGYLLFEAWQPFTLLSVTVYVPQGAPAGIRFVQLVSGDSILASKSFPVLQGINKLDLNFTVPVGTFVLRSPQGNLFRNYGNLSYPYSIGDAGQIMTSSFGDNYYYFFYDWEIKTADNECISERIPVNVLITDIIEPELEFPGHISPNPNNGDMVISFNHPMTGILTIYSTTGTAIWDEVFTEKQIMRLSLSDVPSGVYTIQLKAGNKAVTKRIIVF